MSKHIGNHDDYDAAPEVLNTPDEGWDTLTRTVRLSAASLLAAHEAFPKGQAHPDYENMFVADRQGFRELACGLNRFEGEVIYQGIADETRPLRFQIDSYGERSTYDAVISPASATPAPTDVSQPRLGVTVRYIAIGRPDTSDVGTNVAPPTPPDGSWALPGNAFSGASDVILAYPDGWVLEKRTGPNVPGTEIWLVEDNYVYYLEWRPQG
jgi:hypothetical protein